jgi:5-keto 4-deoxyuronate isomerase
MQIRFESSPREVKTMDTASLRREFLVENLMTEDNISLTYSHYDRLIIGGTKPVKQSTELKTHEELKADYFLQRRELGIINVGGKGSVEVDGETDRFYYTIMYNDKAVGFFLLEFAHDRWYKPQDETAALLRSLTLNPE